MPTIKELIQELAGTDEKIYSQLAEVKEVDPDELTCTVQPLDETLPELFNVRLQAVETPEKAIVQIPKVGAIVLVTFINRTTGFISHSSDLEEFRLTMGNTKLVIKEDGVEMDADQITFNGGDNGGLLNINDVVGKFNDFKNHLNSLQTAFNTHIHTGNLGAPTTPILAQFTTPPPNTTNNDLEDDKIIH